MLIVFCISEVNHFYMSGLLSYLRRIMVIPNRPRRPLLVRDECTWPMSVSVCGICSQGPVSPSCSCRNATFNHEIVLVLRSRCYIFR